jgi:hypothetical protein
VAVPAASWGRLVVAGGCDSGFRRYHGSNTKAQRCCTKGQYPRVPILSDTQRKVSGIFESTDVHLEWPFLFPARKAMDVGTAPESPPGASACARGRSAPRPGAQFIDADQFAAFVDAVEFVASGAPSLELSGWEGAASLPRHGGPPFNELPPIFEFTLIRT